MYYVGEHSHQLRTQRRWRIPAVDEEFVARMEDFLDLYERPLESGEGKVCVKERPCPLRADIRPGLPMESGQPAREDYTDERKGAGNLFVVLAPEQGWRAERFWLHPTPRHARWLNMAEIEISALERQCLDRRIRGMEARQREVVAWVQARNEARVTVYGQFTSRDARQKMARSYPKIKNE
ncbi:hypothetical protein HRbin08_01917 [bacterium HR08]|nr:hypothetical protein HRbin08_01917 [bacterium HR08]